MSGVVSFSGGDCWFVNGAGWRELAARTRAILDEDGQGVDVSDVGLFFEDDPDEVRLPVARALLAAARGRWREVLADGGDGDHLRQLVDLLEIEIVTERAPFIKFLGTRWTTDSAGWQQLADRATAKLADLDRAQLARHIHLPGVRFDRKIVSEEDSWLLAEAFYAAATELRAEDSRFTELMELLAPVLASATAWQQIKFSDRRGWQADFPTWERLTALARSELARRGVARFGAALAALGPRGLSLTAETPVPLAEALLSAARELRRQDLAAGRDAANLHRLTILLEAQLARDP